MGQINEMEATYSPEDNKLRLYVTERLSPELYARVKAAHFRWAPAQKLFYAPTWRPSSEDLLIELCGFIQDEQTSLEERAEQRAERFAGYQENRAKDSAQAYEESQSLAAMVPMGQPILIGHHSQRKAEKNAERIESTMKRAVKMWDCSEYWESRIKGVLSNVKYKERTDVRLRRIKKIEAMKRKEEKEVSQSKNFLLAWNDDSKELTLKRALALSGFYSCGGGIYSKLSDGKLTPGQAKEKAIASYERNINHYERWIKHNTLRLNYEYSILKAEGWTKPAPVKKAKLPPIVNYDGEGFHHITKLEFKSISSDYRFCRTKLATEEHREHRVRFVQNFRLKIEGKDNWGSTKVFITDQKIVELPKAVA
jgi:hypothetical protein